MTVLPSSTTNTDASAEYGRHAAWLTDSGWQPADRTPVWELDDIEIQVQRRKRHRKSRWRF